MPFEQHQINNLLPHPQKNNCNHNKNCNKRNSPISLHLIISSQTDFEVNDKINSQSNLTETPPPLSPSANSLKILSST